MFDQLSTEDIAHALDDLIVCFGVREDIPHGNLIKLLRNKETQTCVQQIAALLSLPIHIKLHFVSDSFNPNSAVNFHSTGISRTNWMGQGTSGITAQVLIPDKLPMFGTSALQGYPIEVRITPSCLTNPFTAIAILAHELSHVLLACVSPKYRHSELHTDCVPIILGFRTIVRKGRKVVENTTSGETITTQTTTFGYLSDSQFEFACKYVESRLSRHSTEKLRLLELVTTVERKLRSTTRRLTAFNDFFQYLDRYPPEKMRQKHAERIVMLHQEDYISCWGDRIEMIRSNVQVVKTKVAPITHYLPRTIQHFKTDTSVLEEARKEIDILTKEIVVNEKVLRKYVGYSHRFRRFLKQFLNGN